MAHVIYFATTPAGEIVKLNNVSYAPAPGRHGYVEKFCGAVMSATGRQVLRDRGDSRAVGTGPDGIKYAADRMVERPSMVSLHPCDGRCTSAKGHKCECACGGKNHGADR